MSIITITKIISTIIKMTTYLLQLQMGFNSIPLSTLVPNIGLLTLAPILLQVLLLIPPLLNIVLFLVVDILLVFSELVSASLFTFTGRCWQVASCSSTERRCFCKHFLIARLDPAGQLEVAKVKLTFCTSLYQVAAAISKKLKEGCFQKQRCVTLISNIFQWPRFLVLCLLKQSHGINFGGNFA